MCNSIKVKGKRNISIPTLKENLVLLFNQIEIAELKDLLSYQFYQKYQRISYNKIDYTFMEINTFTN